MEWIPVDDQQIMSCLALEYGLRDAHLTFLPISYAGETWVFHAETARGVFFLKLKRRLHEAGVAVSKLLLELGIPVITPIQAKNKQLWARLEDFSLLVFPFVEGHPIDPTTLDDSSWRTLGAIMRGVHNAPVPQALLGSLNKELFSPYGQESFSKIESTLASGIHTLSPVQREFADLWMKSQGLVEGYFALVQEKGQEAFLSSPSWCLCHGDLQPGNILQSGPNKLLLIDWDCPVWAPPERDLMFIDAQYRSRFEAGYGRIETNKHVADYLSANWLLQEILDYAERILFSAYVDDKERRSALDAMSALIAKIGDNLGCGR